MSCWWARKRVESSEAQRMLKCRMICMTCYELVTKKKKKKAVFTYQFIRKRTGWTAITIEEWVYFTITASCSHPFCYRDWSKNGWSEEQAGFKAGISTIDQILSWRQIAEKYTELSKELYVCCIDFRKALYSVWREGSWKVMRHLGYSERVSKS